MPTIDELGRLVKEKYPAYANIEDGQVGRLVKQKYPGSYQNYVEASPQTPPAGQLDDIDKATLGNNIAVMPINQPAQQFNGPQLPNGQNLPTAAEAAAGTDAVAKATVQKLLRNPGIPGMEQLGQLPGITTPNPIQPLTTSLGAPHGRNADGFSAADFGGQNGAVNVPQGEFHDAMTAYGDKVLGPTPEGTGLGMAVGRGTAKFLLNMMGPDSAATMLAFELGGAAAPAIANAAPVARALRDLPKVAKALDVVGQTAAPAAGVYLGGKAAVQGGKQAYDQVQQGDYSGAVESATETALGALLAGLSVRDATAKAKETLASFPSAKNAPATFTAGQDQASTLRSQGKRLAADQWADQARKVATNKWQQVFGDEIPVEFNGENHTIRYQGAGERGRPSFELVNDSTGEVVYSGYGRAMQDYLRGRAKPKTEVPAEGAPAAETSTAPTTQAGEAPAEPAASPVSDWIASERAAGREPKVSDVQRQFKIGAGAAIRAVRGETAPPVKSVPPPASSESTPPDATPYTDEGTAQAEKQDSEYFDRLAEEAKTDKSIAPPSPDRTPLKKGESVEWRGKIYHNPNDDFNLKGEVLEDQDGDTVKVREQASQMTHEVPASALWTRDYFKPEYPEKSLPRPEFHASDSELREQNEKLAEYLKGDAPELKETAPGRYHLPLPDGSILDLGTYARPRSGERMLTTVAWREPEKSSGVAISYGGSTMPYGKVRKALAQFFKPKNKLQVARDAKRAAFKSTQERSAPAKAEAPAPVHPDAIPTSLAPADAEAQSHDTELEEAPPSESFSDLEHTPQQPDQAISFRDHSGTIRTGTVEQMRTTPQGKRLIFARDENGKAHVFGPDRVVKPKAKPIVAPEDRAPRKPKELAPTTKVIKTYTNEAEGTEAVVAHTPKGYSVAFRDADADEHISTSPYFKTEDEAHAAAAKFTKQSEHEPGEDVEPTQAELDTERAEIDKERAAEEKPASPAPAATDKGNDQTSEERGSDERTPTVAAPSSESATVTTDTKPEASDKPAVQKSPRKPRKLKADVRDESTVPVTDGGKSTPALEDASPDSGEGAGSKGDVAPSSPRRPRAEHEGSSGIDGHGDGLQQGLGADEGEVPVSSGRGDSPAPRRRPVERPKSERDFRLTPEHLADLGGKVGRFRGNIAAIKTLKQILAENREATLDEKQTLARYVGWGALSEEAFGYSYERSITALQSELRELLTDEEYAAARASTKNAHYTTPDVITGMWKAAEHLGIRPQSRILEPSVGVGHFFGLQPEHMLPAWRSATELDHITGNIARMLYPDAQVLVMPYQQAPFPNNYFDLAIGNVPFGKIQVADSSFRRNPEVLNGIHNYFFAKSLQQVKPGGLVAFVTSRYTMDRSDSSIRKYLAENAELVGAIRLPGGRKGAFAKNAGTEVTTDIIFLRKRRRGEAPSEAENQWTGTVDIDAPKEDGTTGKVLVNEYYAKHPEMMLGAMELKGSQYSEGEPVLIGEFTPEALAAAVERMPKGILDPTSDAEVFTAPPIALTQDDFGVKDGGFTQREGKLYRREGNELKPITSGAAIQKRITGMIGVRDALRQVYAAQYADQSDAEVKAAQTKLGKVYDAFVKQHGAVTAKENMRAFDTDPDYPVIAALENIDKKTGKLVKSAVFSERTIEPYRPVTKVDTAADALGVVLAERGRVDLDRMERLTGKTRDELVDELGDAVYETPGGEVLAADEYLSGNVRQKLAEAKLAAQHEGKYQRNVEALEKVQPRELAPHQITVRFGVPWVPLDDYRDFLVGELFGATSDYARKDAAQWIRLEYSPVSATWTIHVTTQGRENGVNKKYDKHFYGDQLAEMALMMKRPKVYDTFPDGSSRLNPVKTLQSEERQNRLMASFDKWLHADPARSERLTKLYNEKHNAQRLREFDGKHLKFPGMNKAILRGGDLDAHQKNAAWRVISTGNTLLAHAVGAGKTYEMIAAGMEMKRMGLIRKPMYVVPNHMVQQFGADVLKLYPNANVFIADKTTFSKGKRQLTASRIAAGNFDAIVLAHKSFEALPVSDETYNRFVEQEMKEINEELARLQSQSSSKGKKEKKGRTVKALETRKENLQNQLEKRAKREKKDNAVDFETLGVDQLFVDEAHMYKNLGYTSSMDRIAGLPNTNSNRAFDMFIKSRWLNERSGGRGVVFATGTPVANTMAELYTMMRYLALPYLEQHGIAKFDAWAAMFGTAARSTEVAPEGGKFRQNTRFVEFVNAAELITGFRTVADVKMAKDLNLPKPTLKTGKPIVVAVPSHPLLKAFVRLLGARAEAIRSGQVDPSEDNMLKITHEGRMAALDIRLFQHEARQAVGVVAAMITNLEGALADAKTKAYTDAKERRKAATTVRLQEKELQQLRDVYAAALPYTADASLIHRDVENLKLHAVANNVARIWQETKAKRSTQVIFLDLSTPKAEKEEEGKDEQPAEEDAPDAMAASAYAELRDILVKRGVPAEDIRFIHEAKNDEQKVALFKAVREGKIRVVLGSTEKMGAGTNMQDKMIALHHVDVPWRPADIEQRNGRIERQGNENPEVEIYNYVTQGSFDAYMWQGIATKAKMIGAAMSGDLTIRKIADTSTQVLSAKETLALASGDPLVQERIETESKVADLQRSYGTHMDLVAEHTRELAGSKRRIAQLQTEIERTTKALAAKEEWLDAERAKVKAKKPDLAADKLEEETERNLLKIPGNKDPKGEDLKDVVVPMKKGDEDIRLGTYGPFTLLASASWYGNVIEVEGSGWTTGVDKNTHGASVMSAIRSWWNNLNANKSWAKLHLKEAEGELAVREGRSPGEFEKAAELQEAQARLEELNREFGLYDDEGAPTEEGDGESGGGVVSDILSDESGSFRPGALVDRAKEAWDSDAAKGARDFFKPTGTRIAEQGKAGVKLRDLLVKARDEGEVAAGPRVARLVYDSGVGKLSRDERFNLMDTLDGKGKPMNAAVSSAFTEVRGITDELANEALRIGVKVKRTVRLGPNDPIPAGATLNPLQVKARAAGQFVTLRAWVPYQKRNNYYPHHIPAVDQLKRGKIRADVIHNIVRRGWRANEADAEKFLQDYITFVETGKGGNALMTWLVQTKQAPNYAQAMKLLESMREDMIRRNRNLEYSRSADLPFFDPDPLRVLPGFITHESKRLAQIEHFGQNHERITRLRLAIKRQGGNSDWVKQAVKEILSETQQPDQQLEALSRWLRKAQGFKLGLAGIPNATQGALNSLLKGDLPSTIAGFRGLVSEKGRRFGTESGASLDSVLNEAMRNAGEDGRMLGTFLKYTGFTATERWNRILAANAGKAWAERQARKLRLAPNNAVARAALTELGIDPASVIQRGGLSPKDVLMAAKKFSDITQFRGGPEDLPQFSSTPIGRVFFQFKSYIYGQSRLIVDSLVGEWQAGNRARVARNLLILAAVFPMVGAVVEAIRGLLKRPTEKDKTIVQRYVEGAMSVGALGVLSDLIQGGQLRKLGGVFLGPSLSTIAEGGEAAVSNDPARNLGKWFTRQLPMGSMLASWLFPPKESSSGHVGNSRRLGSRGRHRR